MKKPSILALIVLLAVSTLVGADEGEALHITTVGGQTYSQCQVVQMYPDGVAFRHSRGMAKILFTDLNPEWRQHFGYDAAKVEAYNQKVSEDRIRARDVAAARTVEVQKAWAEAYVQALQAQAMAQAQAAPQGNYYGGGIGYLDFSQGNQGGWSGNGFDGLGNNRGFNERSGRDWGLNRDNASFFRGRHAYSGFNTVASPVVARASSFRTRYQSFPQAARSAGGIRVK
ncbi:MAG: hypothetical protein JWO94_961 [Verrucomicrobiaceae bacterium]|nr:hypothetical protein [Verrucomicrobiaceae bacterium]